MKHYRDIFFDLDHTLWDTDNNAGRVLDQLYHQYNLAEKGIGTLEAFKAIYKQINERFWMDYAHGLVSKSDLRFKRFAQTLQHFGVKNYDLSYALSADFTSFTPRQKGLMPFALEVLDYLLNKGYTLTILTNGFTDAQKIKITSAGLDSYFTHLVTAEETGFKKPSVEIFNFALQLTKGNPEETLMIGDNLTTDIGGARQAGIDQVYFNPFHEKHEEIVTFEVDSLLGLKEIL